MTREPSLLQERSNCEDSLMPCPIEDFAPGIENAFPAEFQEFDEQIEHVTGRIPDYVRGTFYLNGPARFQAGDVTYQHWLDGDGMVSMLRFDSAGIYFRSRYVRSTKFVREQEAGRALFRTFGTSFQGNRLNGVGNGLENPVNVSIYPFAGHLLAFGEQGLPWKIDPETLETQGQFTFYGRLNDASPMAAHPKIDSESGEMFNFGVFFSRQAPKLYFYCFGADGLRFRKPIPLPYPCSVHDFVLSKHYATFYLSPYLLDIKRFLEEGLTVMESLSWEPELGSSLLIVDRASGEAIASMPVGTRYCLHLINSFDDAGRLTVDVLEFDSPVYSQYQPVPALFTDVPHGSPVRFVIDLKSRQVLDRIALNDLRASDFAAIDPRRTMQPYEDFWRLGISSTGRCGRKFFDQLIHAQWNEPQPSDIYRCPPRCYLGGEPVFVGEARSRNGVVICQEFHSQERASYYLLFDSMNVKSGPISRIRPSQQLYLGFHAIFRS